MHIVCACDEKYVPHTATMLCSVLSHTKTVEAIHLIHNGIQHSVLARLTKFVKGFGIGIEDYMIDESQLEDLVVSGHASSANYFRLLIPEVLPDYVDKVLYLDSDIVALDSLDEIWEIDISRCLLAAAENPGFTEYSRLSIPVEYKYFNSGVMLINVALWRQQKTHLAVIGYIKQNPDRITYWDQDGFNALLYDKWIELSLCWNAQHNLFLEENLRIQYKHVVDKPFILHYSGDGLKPWQYNSPHPLKQKYFEYRKKTPWKKISIEGTPNIHIRIRNKIKSVNRLFSKNNSDT